MTLRHHFVIPILVIGALLGAQLPTCAANDSASVVAAVHAAATASGSAERRATLRTTVQQSFDLPALAQAILRAHWQAASETERSAFVVALGETVVGTLLRRLGPRSGAPFRIVADAVMGSDIVVTSTLTLGPDRLAVIDWRLRPASDPRIVDVIVEGRSLVVSQREELARELAGEASLSAITAALAARAARTGAQ
jgi:ABC-type transporter MlaC component